MKHLIRLLLFIVVFASVCSLDRSVPDCAIMGKWVGAGGAVLVSILAVSIIAPAYHRLYSSTLAELLPDLTLLVVTLARRTGCRDADF